MGAARVGAGRGSRVRHHGLLAVAAFAPGSFGADVGAAIGIPIGTAVAIGVCLGVRRTGWVWVIVAPIAALAALVAVDLILGGDAHLTRTRASTRAAWTARDRCSSAACELSAHSFARYADSFIFWIVIALIVAGLTQWRRIEGWFGGRRTAWAGFVGALAATRRRHARERLRGAAPDDRRGALRGDRRRRLGNARGAPFANLVEAPGPVT